MLNIFRTLQRQVRHWWLAFRSPATRLFSAELRSRLTQHVAASETRHTGQVRIYVETSLPQSYLRRQAGSRQRAITLFGKLRVWDTEQNNGVLIYLLLAEHAIEIVADRGLNQHVPAPVWRSIADRLGQALSSGHWEAGLLQAIDEVTALLVENFPTAAGTRRSANEQPDAPMVR